MSSPIDPRRCICAGGTPVWCDRHGDLWYSDDGDQHLGTPPEDVAAFRRAYDDEASALYPLDWQYPLLGLTVSYVNDDGALVTRGMR